MTMTNNAMVHARGAALGLLLALGAFACGCGTSHAGTPSSSGSHWLTCEVDRECSTKVAGTHCGGDGVCVDKSGARVKDPNAGGGAGSHADAGASGSGSGGRRGNGSGGASSGTGGTVSLRDAG